MSAARQQYHIILLLGHEHGADMQMWMVAVLDLVVRSG
jgi:hypothetical protein